MPGRHNSSSIEGGIFGGPTAGQAAPPPRARDNGIFGAPVQNAPDTRNAVTKSSVEGGIFSEPMAKAPDSARNGVTKSSIEGGIFGGYAHAEAPVNRAPAPKLDNLGTAGTKSVKGSGIDLSWNQENAGLQPLPSARSNPNASSIDGGIFGSAPAAQGRGVSRGNPNASSIEGGIFG